MKARRRSLWSSTDVCYMSVSNNIIQYNNPPQTHSGFSGGCVLVVVVVVYFSGCCVVVVLCTPPSSGLGAGFSFPDPDRSLAPAPCSNPSDRAPVLSPPLSG